MDNVLRELTLDLSLIRSGAGRREIINLYDYYLSNEQANHSLPNYIACAACESRPRKTGYTHCVVCQRFKQSVDQVLSRFPAFARPDLIERRSILRALTIFHENEIKLRIKNDGKLCIGFFYPPEYFALRRPTRLVDLFHPTNIRFFRSKAELLGHNAVQRQQSRQQKDEFHEWLRSRTESN